MVKIKTVLAILGGVAILLIGYFCRGLFDGRLRGHNNSGGGGARPDPSGTGGAIGTAASGVGDAGAIVADVGGQIAADADTVADIGASIGAGSILIQRGRDILATARARAKDNDDTS